MGPHLHPYRVWLLPDGLLFLLLLLMLLADPALPAGRHPSVVLGEARVWWWVGLDGLRAGLPSWSASVPVTGWGSVFDVCLVTELACPWPARIPEGRGIRGMSYTGRLVQCDLRALSAESTLNEDAANHRRVEFAGWCQKGPIRSSWPGNAPGGYLAQVHHGIWADLVPPSPSLQDGNNNDPQRGSLCLASTENPQTQP
ncbi:hypothetical protein P7K49_036616 [Saguinus oedipus]|uniref:Uncharacterized protein n=1 Tax=Saguinus oedipus TaxID=9490 RepID=A0ABQ9TKQ9_SAGOE|nr:hypothetical protein P7K49_036616 [Saguinus oedipus]